MPVVAANERKESVAHGVLRSSVMPLDVIMVLTDCRSTLTSPRSLISLQGALGAIAEHAGIL